MTATQHRWILHIDMDAYFASIEQRDHPAYRNKPVIIGGLSSRGVVATASYEARVYGIRSAMPMTEARRRCPDGIFLKPDINKYAAVSDQIRHIFEKFSPLVEPLSMDEAFLDVTGMEYLYKDATDMARQIKAAIKKELNLTASAGVAANKFLAKLASDLQKPDGLVTIHPGEELSLLAPMPVSKLWGVGHATASLLKKLQIETINDFRNTDVKILEHHLGTCAKDLYNLAWGRDNRPVIPDREAKSIGNENTFATDLRSIHEIKGVLLALSEKIGWRLRKAGLWGRTITIKVRFSSFRTVTRSLTLPSPIALDEIIYQTACEMLHKISLQEGVRLLGITISKLGPESSQLSLFDDKEESNERQVKITAVMDQLKDKFGETIIARGRVK